MPANADPGVILSMTMVSLVLRKDTPAFSLGVRFMTLQDTIEGIVNGSRPFTGARVVSDVLNTKGPTSDTSTSAFIIARMDLGMDVFDFGGIEAPDSTILGGTVGMDFVGRDCG